MELKPDQLVSRLADAAPDSLYLIAGPETLLVIEAADAVRRAAREHGCTEREVFEVTNVRESKSEDRATVWTEIAGTINAPSLFSPRRLIEIRIPSGKPGTEGAKFLETLANDIPAGVIVMVLADEWSKKHAGKWSQAIEKNGTLSVAWQVKNHELSRWMSNRLRTRNLNLDPEALKVLVDLIDGNLLAAAQEVEKLALLTSGEPTTLDARQLRELVADLAKFDVFRLTETAWNGHGAQALRILNGLQAEGVAVPALMGFLVRELQTTATLAQAVADGSTLQSLFRSLYIWEARQPMYKRALERHSAVRWQRFLVAAGRVDRASKGRETGDAWMHLQRLIAAIANRRATPMLTTQMRAA